MAQAGLVADSDSARFAVAWELRIVVGLAVGTGLVTGAPLHWFMIPAYLLLIVQTWFAPRSIVPVA